MKMHYGILLILCAMLPGCSNLIQWGKRNFYQGDDVPTQTKIVQKYIRSVVAYDQFKTQALFDVLWLSDAVRTAYVDAFSMRTGKDEEQKALLLSRELEENNYYITFYLLSLYSTSLVNPNSTWVMSLEIDNVLYQPLEVKYLELAPEYSLFFGKKINTFKVPYQVRFDAYTADSEQIFSEGRHTMTLYFRSVDKEVHLQWKIMVNGDGEAYLQREKMPKIVRGVRS